MKHLFIVRHGDYGEDKRIDDKGRKQMELLGKRINQILDGKSGHLISSTAPWAIDSSQILVAHLALPPEFEQVPYIWSGSSSPKDSFYRDMKLDKLMSIIDERRDKADGLVMVTHLEVTESFPIYFLRMEFGQDSGISTDGILKGQAIHFNLEQKTHQLISPSLLDKI